jgi:hypothetical protein
MANFGPYLLAGQALTSQNNDFICSPNGTYYVVVEADGNLSIYPCNPATMGTATGPAIWTSNSHSATGAYYALLDATGNFAVYSGSGPGSGAGTPVWSANSSPGSTAYVTALNLQYSLMINPDGNLCVYPTNDPEVIGHADAIWSSRDLLLLQRFAPIVYLHPNDAYRPCSVEWYLQRTALYNAAGQVVYSPVIDGTSRVDSSVLADTRLNERAGWYLKILNNASRAGDLSTAKVYAYVRPVRDDNGNVTAYDLVYSFLYAFNGNTFIMSRLVGYIAAYVSFQVLTASLLFFIPGVNLLIPVIFLGESSLDVGAIVGIIQTWDGVDMHEGDFEQVTVRVTPDMNSILAVYYAQHDKVSKSITPKTDPNDPHRIIVYSAQNSHASYPDAASHSRVADLAPDITQDNPPGWDTRSALVNVGYNENATDLIDFPAPSANNQFDNGRMPTVAVASFPQSRAQDDPATDPLPPIHGVVSVHRDAGGGSRYYWNTGTIENNQITWHNANAGTQFDVGNGGLCVGMNNDGIVLSLHRNDSNYYWNLGVFNTDVNTPATLNTITWTKGTKRGTQFATAPAPGVHGMSNPYSDPAVAINNDGVICAVFRSGNSYYYMIGVISVDAGSGTSPKPPPAITWKTSRPAAFWTGNDSALGMSGPGVSLNDENEVVVVHNTSNLTYSVGEVNPDAGTIHFDTLGKTGGGVTGAGGYQNPNVALSDQGLVVTVYTVGGTAYYNIGQIEDQQQGSTTYKDIHWFSSSGVSYTAADYIAVDFPSDDPDEDALLEVHATNNQLFATIANITKDNYDDWTPANGQWWLKYRGIWGNKGGSPILQIGDTEIYYMSDGPTGPAYKDNWAGGPDA